ncbi:MAG: DUF6602 domain-containing protein [Thermodesulfobacteriota bacterium]
MPIQQDFLSYHKSIGRELKSSERRIRDLIGSSHWLTDGEHKESILRKVISDFAPEIYRIGTGFVCYPGVANGNQNNSGQLDILITSKMNPTLYKSGELHFVTPDCANAIIEVKTKVSNGEKLREVLSKLSNDIESIRNNSDNSTSCWAGLFIYNTGQLTDRNVLEMLQSVTNGDRMRVINCVAIGENKFVRFWEHGHSTSNLGQDPIWHSYDLRDLSHAYFVSNLISHLSPNFDDISSEAWFPVTGSKEIHRSLYAKLADNVAFEFQQG